MSCSAIEGMAIGILFLKGDEPIARVVVSCREFDTEILSNISDEEYKKWFPDFDDNDEQMVTDKECIIKVWNSCINYDYISEDFDIFCNYIDKMQITY